MTNKPIPFEEFKAIYSKVPRLCVDLVIQNNNGETLLTRRAIKPWQGMWHMPGGTVLFNEPLKRAAERLAKKELGIVIKIKKELGTLEFLGQDIEHKFDHSVSVVYLCEPESLNFELDEDTAESRFFENIPENTVKEHKQFLQTMG